MAEQRDAAAPGCAERAPRGGGVGVIDGVGCDDDRPQRAVPYNAIELAAERELLESSPFDHPPVAGTQGR